MDLHGDLGATTFAVLGLHPSIAPMETARLTVTAAGGQERELRITARSAAYVAAVTAPAWTLTGYGADGERLGELALDHLGADA